MKDPLAELIKSHLAAEGKYICQLSEGIYVIVTPRQHSDKPMSFDVVWDPELWRLGRENPKKCFMQVEFNNFQSDNPQSGESLIGFLRNTMTPLREDLTLRPIRNPTHVAIESVTAS